MSQLGSCLRIKKKKKKKVKGWFNPTINFNFPIWYKFYKR